MQQATPPRVVRKRTFPKFGPSILNLNVGRDLVHAGETVHFHRAWDHALVATVTWDYSRYVTTIYIAGSRGVL